MHTQHVKFSVYVAWGGDLGGVVAVGVVFEEGEVVRLVEDDDRSVVALVVAVVIFSRSPLFFLVVLVLLDVICTI
jgi:hypothetical protein